MPSLGYRPKSIITFQYLDLSVSLLCKLPIQVGPGVEVNRRGLCVLQQRGQLFCLAHTGKLCTCSHEVNVRAFQIAFLFYSLLSADGYRVDYWLHGSSFGSMWIQVNCGLALMMLMSERFRLFFYSTYCWALMDIGLITGCMEVASDPCRSWCCRRYF